MVFYTIRQNNNKKSSGYGKWYGRVKYTGDLDTDEIAERVQAKCALHKSDVVGCIEALLDEIKMGLANSQRVVLKGLGVFKVGMNTKPANERDEFGANNVKSTHVIFQAERKKDADTGAYTRALTSGIRFREWGSATASSGSKSTDSKSSDSSSDSSSNSGSGSSTDSKSVVITSVNGTAFASLPISSVGEQDVTVVGTNLPNIAPTAQNATITDFKVSDDGKTATWHQVATVPDGDSSVTYAGTTLYKQEGSNL